MAGEVGLSVLARLMRQGRFEEFETGESGPRVSALPPALRGFTRGTLGATGSTFGPKTRNSDAAEQHDRATIQELLQSGFRS